MSLNGQFRTQILTQVITGMMNGTEGRHFQGRKQQSKATQCGRPKQENNANIYFNHPKSYPPFLTFQKQKRAYPHIFVYSCYTLDQILKLFKFSSLKGICFKYFFSLGRKTQLNVRKQHPATHKAHFSKSLAPLIYMWEILKKKIK